jgi:cyclopropane fatty-acyl-phospholipid synthase-like methyltransferase/DUF1365 family protein
MAMTTPSLYEVDIRHARTDPVRHDVRHRSYLWFVDLDALPDHGPLGRFESRDHLGDPNRSLRDNVTDFLGDHGIELHGGRITMLANARAFGYVFNPLTLYWCHDADGALRCVVAEVHNTYGQRHRYLLRPDDDGRTETAKEFYVSPFYPVDGYYRMRLPEPRERLSLTVSLHRPGERPFTATVRGVGLPATRRALWRTALRHPFETWTVRALITAHGIALWRKGLPVRPRPPHPFTHATSPEHAMPKHPVADRLATLVERTVGVAAAELPVRIRAWDGSEVGPAGAPTVVIRNRRALRRLLWAPGELGLARAYVTGDIDVEGDLADGFRRVWRSARSRAATGVSVRPAGAARAAFDAARLGAVGTPPRPPASEARLSGGVHTQRRDRAAIAHHYDLSNDFYALLLDESMAYSCAYFTAPSSVQSLADAQRAKLDLVCRKLALQPGSRLLDVGCGWGSLALHAAERFGAQVTAITLSAQQRDHVAKRIADRGLADRVEVRLQDYRELADDPAYAGSFDAVSSIEMGEHVGEGQYPAYAAILHRALRPTGRLLLQQMSRRADAAPGGGIFIESYIAPDMHMRPLPATLAHLERAGFEIRDVEGMREHYVRTVEAWIETFEANWDRFVALQGEEVARVWRLYLVGGALSFAERRMGVDQILAVRCTADGTSAMPATRPWAAG